MNRPILISVVLSVLALPTILFAQIDTSWARRYNDPNNGWDEGKAITYDHAGNVYVGGQSSETNGDYYIMKYDRSGVLQWASRYNGPGNNTDYPVAMAIDPSNNLLVTGQCIYGGHGIIATIKYNSAGDTLWTAVYYGGGSPSLVFDLAVNSLGDVYITGRGYGISSNAIMTIKYNSLGEEQWVRFYEGEDGYGGEGHGIAVDDSGYVYVGGSSATDSSGADFLLIKYNPNGDSVWATRYSSNGYHSDFINRLALDNLGNIYATGPSQPGQSTDSQDILTIKYNSSGVIQWIQRYNGPANLQDYPIDIVHCPNGNICVTGFSGGGSATYNDYVTISYSPDSTQNWAARYDGPVHRAEMVAGIATDFMSNVYVTGYSPGSSFNNDYATVKYSPAGVEQWVMRYNGPDNQADQAEAIAADSAGNVYVTGYSSGNTSSADILTIKYGVASQGIDDEATVLPSLYDISQNYPNPFNPSTSIKYDLPKSSDVTLEVFDLLGRKVDILVSGRQEAGRHTIVWDGKGNPSGIYFYRIRAGEYSESRRMLLLK